VGRPDASNKQDIQLQGPGIATEHCAFYMKNNYVCVAPCKDAHTWVNGKLIQGETVLHHGDRIVLGINHFFRLNCPVESTNADSMITHSKSDTDFSKAQEEVLLSNKLTGSDNNEMMMDDESKSILSSNSNSIADENGIVLELAIQKLEQDFSSINSSSNLNRSASNVTQVAKRNEKRANFRKGLKILRSKLQRINSLVREANSLCREMNKMIRFSVTLQIPAYNLTPNRNVKN
jgi:kinesin family protein 13